MTATKPALPAGAQLGFSYERGVDIDTAYPSTASWQTIRRITAVAPTPAPITQDAASYDDFGAPNEDKTSESWGMTFGVLVNRLTSGLYPVEVEALKAYTEPDALGEDAVAHVRYYDKPVSGTPNPNDAYEGLCTVSIVPGKTDNTGVAMWNVTLTGKGRRTQITNPFTGWGAAVPTIESMLPELAGVGELVRIDGSGFTGTTGITVDGETVLLYEAISDGTIEILVPAAVTGAAPTIVTNATGASDPYAYVAATP